MQFEGGKAFVRALLDVPLVLFHRVPSYRRSVGRNPWFVAADELVKRQARLARFDVPGEKIDQSEMRHLHLLDAVDLPNSRP
jgi:hypothetical protein